MKKILFLLAIAAFSGGAVFAQKSAVKDAKRALGSNDLSEARTLIVPATTNPETAKDPDTWKIYGDIGNKAFDNERASSIIGKQHNEKAMYEGLLESYRPYVISDSLGELPNEKGKVKNNVRKDIVNILRANHPYYINAGIYFSDQKDMKKAADCFEIYWNLPDLTLFAGEKTPFVKDSTYQIIKYYAIISSIQGQDHKRAIKLLQRASKEQFIENSQCKESDLYELLASEYYQQGDSVNFMNVLHEGAEKFPKVNYFMSNLVNVFIRQGQHDKAMQYLDQAIQNDPTNACDFNSVKGALLTEAKKYEEADVAFQKALAQDPNCERALEALAVNYIVRAQDLKEISASLSDRKQQAENDKAIVDLYQKSAPLLERYRDLLKARNAEESDIKAALFKLQNAYYNLSNLGIDKSKELDEIEKVLGTN
ncbi:MAG: hypothetical protein LBR48_03375 [Dysgonamonadaceae bacterium]|nr:hypothetical protein [Dysgonamonadaceae bacterium]